MDQLAPVLPRQWTDVDDPVGGPDRVLVVLDDEERVAEVTQPLERGDEARVVALVEPDRRLVEDVEHAHERRADLRRQPDALRLAARQRSRVAVEGEVIEPDVDEEAEPRADLLQHLARDRVLALVQTLGERGVPGQRIGHRQLRGLDDVPIPDRDRQRLRLEPHPPAGRARLRRHVALDLGAHHLAAGLPVSPLEVRDDALEARLERMRAAAARLVAHVDALAAVAVQQDPARVVGELCDGEIGPEAVMLRDRVENLAEP